MSLLVADVLDSILPFLDQRSLLLFTTAARWGTDCAVADLTRDASTKSSWINNIDTMNIEPYSVTLDRYEQWDSGDPDEEEEEPAYRKLSLAGVTFDDENTEDSCLANDAYKEEEPVFRKLSLPGVTYDDVDTEDSYFAEDAYRFANFIRKRPFRVDYIKLKQCRNSTLRVLLPPTYLVRMKQVLSSGCC
jgi:hypothetical protein